MTLPFWSASARQVWPLSAASFAWNLGLGMTYVLVPLYARSLGLSGVAIGSLVSLPVLIQVGFNLVGGAYTDRIGGRVMMLGSCWATALAGVVFAFADTLTALFVAQFFVIIGRAMFWPATWSVGSELPGDRPRRLSRLNFATSVGQIAGTASAGWLIVTFGYRVGFGVYTGMSLLALASLAVFIAPARRAVEARPLFANYARLLKRRGIYFGILCAYISALPFSLSASFYPILLVETGYESDAAGVLLALRGVGASAAGLVAGHLIRRTTRVGAPFGAALAVGLSVVLVAWFQHPLPVGFFLLAVGLGSAFMTIYFQMLISEISSSDERGSAMALGGLGWSLSHLTTPLAMGALNDTFGIVTAFYVLGAVAIAWSGLLVWVHRAVHRGDMTQGG